MVRTPPGAAWYSSTASSRTESELQVPGAEEFPQRVAVHGADGGVEQAGPVQLAEDGRDAPGPVHVLHVVAAARGDLAQAGHPARQLVDLLEAEVHAALVRRGEQVQDRVGRSAHRHVQRHRVLERVPAGDGAGQHRLVAVGVVAAGQLGDRGPRPLEQAAPRSVRGQRGPIAGQREADRLGQAVHRVGREHAGAGTARRAGGLLHVEQLGVRHRGVRRGDHRVDQVELPPARGEGGRAGRAAGFHRAAGDEDGRDVQPHRRDQHAGRDLVAVGDADQRVRAVRVHHVLDRVGDQLAARQRVQHAAVAHRDAIVHGDGVELARDRPGRADRVRDDLGDLTQVDVPGHELGEAVGDRYDRPADVLAGDARGAQQGTGPRHVSAVRDSAGPKRWHGRSSPKCEPRNAGKPCSQVFLSLPECAARHH